MTDVLLTVVYDDRSWRHQRVIEDSYFDPDRGDEELVSQASVNNLVGVVRPCGVNAAALVARLERRGVPILEPGDARIHSRAFIEDKNEPRFSFFEKLFALFKRRAH